MHRKPLALGRRRARLSTSGIDRAACPLVSEDMGRDVGNDAQQVELLATRRRIVSTTSRPRDALMACLAEPERCGCAWGRGAERRSKPLLPQWVASSSL